MSAVRKMTKMSGPLRPLASLLQSHGRGNDSVLAHITPREAALLKVRGGRGSVNPHTGLLEFDDGDPMAGDFSPPQDTTAPAPEAPAQDIAPPAPQQDFSFPALDYSLNAPSSQGMRAPENVQLGAGYDPSLQSGPGLSAPPGFDISQVQGAPTAPTAAPGDQPPGFFSKLGASAEKAITNPEVLARLGIGALGTIPGIIQGRRAGVQGQQAAQQQRAIAAPYQSQGQQLQAMAQAGQLTPAGQQQLDAVRAQMQQDQAARGGVGAIQADAAVERLKQQLLQSQADFGVKLSSIGDQIALGAIQTGLQADRYVQNLQSQYFTNLARMLGGQAPQVPSGG